jgi:hypothetical protein
VDEDKIEEKGLQTLKDLLKKMEGWHILEVHYCHQKGSTVKI